MPLALNRRFKSGPAHHLLTKESRPCFSANVIWITMGFTTAGRIVVDRARFELATYGPPVSLDRRDLHDANVALFQTELPAHKI